MKEFKSVPAPAWPPVAPTPTPAAPLLPVLAPEVRILSACIAAAAPRDCAFSPLEEPPEYAERWESTNIFSSTGGDAVLAGAEVRDSRADLKRVDQFEAEDWAEVEEVEVEVVEGAVFPKR